MMKKRISKLLSAWLALCMTLALLPSAILAEEPEPEPEQEQEQALTLALESAETPQEKALALAFIEEDPPQTQGRVGEEILWTFACDGAAQITYAVLLDALIIEEEPLAPAVSPMKYTPEEPGEYILRLTAWDAEGNQLMRESRPIAVMGEAAQAAPAPEPEPKTEDDADTDTGADTAPDALAATLVIEPEHPQLGDTITLTPQASGGHPPYSAAMGLFLDGAPVEPVSDDAFSFALAAEGVYTAILQITDADGAMVEAMHEIDCRAETDGEDVADDGEGEEDALSALAEQILRGHEAPPSDDTALEILAVDADTAEAAIGDTLCWRIDAQGGQAPLSYQYQITLDGEVIASSESVEDAVSLTWEAQEAGTYAVLVTVTDAGDGMVSALSMDTIVAAPESDDTAAQAPEFRSMKYPGEGPGVSVKADAGTANDGAVVIARFAMISELQIAYVHCQQSIFPLGSTATWETKAIGGDGDYQYSYTLFRQSFDDIETKFEGYAAVGYSASPTYSFNITLTGRYFVECFVKDSKGDTVSFYSAIIETMGEDDLTNEATVAGKAAAIIASEITSGMSDEQKALALHNWLVNNADYDQDENNYHFQADGVLLKGSGVCQSYTLAYLMLCRMAGLECEMVTGRVGKIEHAWNIVKIDGVWLHVDVTWDDPYGQPPSTAYFLRDDAYMIASNHVWNSTPVDGTRIDGLYPTVGEIIVTAVSLGNPVSILLGARWQLTPVIYPVEATNKTLTWKVADERVMTIDSTGTVTGIAPGTTTVTATSASGREATVEITVLSDGNLRNVSFMQGANTIELYGDTRLNLANQIEYLPATAEATYTWELLSGDKIVSIDAKGVVTPLAVGSASVRATVQPGGAQVTTTVSVVDSITPTGIVIAQGDSLRAASGGRAQQLTATLYPQGTARSTITWTTSNDRIATVSATGLLTPIAPGSATITATTQNGKAASIAVTVYDANNIETLAFTGSAVSVSIISPGISLAQYLTYSPSTSDSTFAWTVTSGTDIVSVDAGGTVKPLRVGTATVTATAIKGGKTASIRVSVVSATGTSSGPLSNATTRPIIVTASPAPTKSTATAKPAATQGAASSSGSTTPRSGGATNGTTANVVTPADTTPMDVPEPQARELTAGTMQDYNYGRVTLHAYEAADPISSQNILLETTTALVLIDAPGFTENMQELKAQIDGTGKPVVSVLLPHHLSGAGIFDGAPLLTTQKALDQAQVGCSVTSLTDDFSATYEEVYDDTIPENVTIITPGNVTIEGMEFIITETPDGFDVGIPLLKALYTHMLGADTHSLLASAAELDESIARLKGYQEKDYELFLSAHHAPEDQEALAEKIAYLEKMKELSTTSDSRNAFLEAMRSTYPDCEGADYLLATAEALFP